MRVRSELRAQVAARSAGFCEWPGCSSPGEQMAHVHGIGMGGRRSADTIGNVWWACVWHHDMFDGRRMLKKFELAELMRGYLEARYGGSACR